MGLGLSQHSYCQADEQVGFLMPGDERRPRSTRLKPNDLCPCGSGTKYKKCCRDQGEVVDVNRKWPTKTLVIETERGLFSRKVLAPIALRTDVEEGKAAEEATLEAALVWGLPDFVFHPKEEAAGSGTRELGDGTVLVGDLALALQCKRRCVEPQSESRELSWLNKNIETAIRQGNGTIRRFGLKPKELTNARGLTQTIDARNKDWTIVVVVDHSDVPDDFVADVNDSRNPVVVLTRQDWEFLFDQLKSTTAVARYLQRSRGDARTLGAEELLYYELAAADESTPPEDLPRSIAGLGTSVSEPMLPFAPVAHTDLPAFAIVRSILEDIALMNNFFETGAEGLEVLAALDGLPVENRRLLGDWILSSTKEVFTRTDSEGKNRVIVADRYAPHFGFSVCPLPFSDEVSTVFGAWLELRHVEHQEALENDDILTVGLLITPTVSTKRPFDLTVKALKGETHLSPERRGAIEEYWGRRSDVSMPMEPPSWERGKGS